jgi:hypothetical protein
MSSDHLASATRQECLNITLSKVVEDTTPACQAEQLILVGAEM